MNYIDVHCHLNNEDFPDLGGLIESFFAAGIKKLVCIGFDIPSSQFACELSEKYPFIYFSAGFHPTELKKYREGDLDIIRELCKSDKCVALGEIGLDYHYPDTDKKLQKEIFLRQLHMAKELNIPVQIHSRDCAEDMLNILKDNKELYSQGALLHCFSHSVEIALELEKLGIYFSFGGTSTYSGSKKAKRAIAALSESRLLSETDSPYLPPRSIYGTFPNTPLSIPEIVKNMAQVRNVTEEQMALSIWNNAHTLFKKLNA
jgi:TatD DNase family protein